MRLSDRIAFGISALRGHRLRSGLSVLGVAIGITAVILLTSIGEGTRRYVFTQFSQFGTNLLSVTPGKSKTTGMPGVLGGSTRKLTIDDAEAIGRLPGVLRIEPQTTGLARVESGGHGRSVPVYGATADMPEVLKMDVAHGSFLPAGDPRRGASVAVLGPKLEHELFGEASSLGQIVRIGAGRFRVIGVLAAKGKILGFDIDDAAYVPIATHMRLFNQDGLEEIHVLFSPGEGTDRVVGAIKTAMIERHGGEEDFTITTQAAMLDVFDNVMDAVTMSVGAMAGISLFVGAIGILTMMWIAVGERTAEIGLARALGATARQVESLFLVEAIVLALVGGIAGVSAGLGIAWLLRTLAPELPVETPVEFVLIAIGVSVITGLVSGVMPARRAAKLDPTEALRAE
jgi:putative ABC transport system permease protein